MSTDKQDRFGADDADDADREGRDAERGEAPPTLDVGAESRLDEADLADPGADVVVDEPVEGPPLKKKSKLPLIAGGIVGVVALMGLITVLVPGAPSQGGSGADSAPAAIPAQTQATASPPPPAPPADAAPALREPQADARAQGPVVTVTPDGANAELTALRARLDQLATENGALREQAGKDEIALKAALSKMPAACVSERAPARAPAVAQSALPRAQPKDLASRDSKPARALIEDVVGTAAPATVLTGLRLRAVHPASGENMQAWIMEGDQLRVVSKGQVIGGAVIREVRQGVVVTDRGEIR